MKIENYSGIDSDSIEIQRPQDLFPLLDWFHTKIMDLGASEEQLMAVSKMMDMAEQNGLGTWDDIDSIEY